LPQAILEENPCEPAENKKKNAKVNDSMAHLENKNLNADVRA
jgi:hypothetical protein